MISRPSGWKTVRSSATIKDAGPPQASNGRKPYHQGNGSDDDDRETLPDAVADVQLDDAIKDQPEGYLEARDALYVVDVSQMPSFITNWVLKPSMCSANYRILLDYESQVATEHLGTGDDVLWLELDDLEVRNRQTFSSSEALREALEQQPQ